MCPLVVMQGQVFSSVIVVIGSMAQSMSVWCFPIGVTDISYSSDTDEFVGMHNRCLITWL